MKACCREPRTNCVTNFCIQPMTHWWKYWQNSFLSPTRTCCADALLGRDSSSPASSCKTWTEVRTSTYRTLVRWRSILAITQDCEGGNRGQGSPSQQRVRVAGTRHAAILLARQVLSPCHIGGEQAGHQPLPGHYARQHTEQAIRSPHGRIDMAQAMQRHRQLWCTLKRTQRTSLPIRHSHFQTQLWSNRTNQMDTSTRWGTDVLPIPRFIYSATDQDGANRGVDRGAIQPCRRRNLQTWHAWRHTAMQDYTEITGATMFKGREMLPSGELRAQFPTAAWEHAQERHCSHDLPRVGGKCHYRMQPNSLSQEKNPAKPALPEQCQLHTWQWLSIQLEGKPCADRFSSSGAPRTWNQLRQPGMRWREMVRRATVAPWILQCILRPCRHSLTIIGSAAGTGSSVRSALLRDSFDAEVANDNIRSMLAEPQPLQGTSLLLSCCERCEAKFEPDFYHAFTSQFGCQFWSLVQEHIPDVWPAKATLESGVEEEEGCRSDKPQKRRKRGV